MGIRVPRQHDTISGWWKDVHWMKAGDYSRINNQHRKQHSDHYHLLLLRWCGGLVWRTKEEWSRCFECCSREERTLHDYFRMGIKTPGQRTPPLTHEDLTIRWFDLQIKKDTWESSQLTGSIHIQGTYLGGDAATTPSTIARRKAGYD